MRGRTGVEASVFKAFDHLRRNRHGRKGKGDVGQLASGNEEKEINNGKGAIAAEVGNASEKEGHFDMMGGDTVDFAEG